MTRRASGPCVNPSTSCRNGLKKRQIQDFKSRTDIEGGNSDSEKHLALESTLRFSSESTLASSYVEMVNHFSSQTLTPPLKDYWQKHDNVKIEESKEGIAQQPEIRSGTPKEEVKLEDDVYFSSLAVPVQKRRRLKLEVVVPTLDLLRRQTTRVGADDDYVQKMRKMKNVGLLSCPHLVRSLFNSYSIILSVRVSSVHRTLYHTFLVLIFYVLVETPLSRLLDKPLR